MKRIAFLFACLTTSFFCQAQSKKVELYDVVKSLLPDSAQTAAEVAWAKLNTNKLVKRPAAKPKFNGTSKEYSLLAHADIAIRGESFSLKWGIELEGSTAGYSKFTISPNEMSDIGFETTLEYLFGKKPYASNVIKKCDQKNEMTYEVKIKGKKTCWLHCFTDGGSTGSAVYIEGYFNQKDLKTVNCD